MYVSVSMGAVVFLFSVVLVVNRVCGLVVECFVAIEATRVGF